MYIKRGILLGDDVELLTTRNSCGFIIRPESYKVKDLEWMKTIQDLIEVIKNKIL